MASSSSTSCPHLGRVVRNLFRLMLAVLHGTETLFYSNYPREASASTCPDIIGRIASSVPWFLGKQAVPMQLPLRCSATVNAATGVGRGSHKQPAIECLTSARSLTYGGKNEVTLS